MAPTPFRAIAFLAATLLWGLAYAQDNEQYAPDPPERAARLSYISGDVSLQPAGEEDWAPAIVNRPLTTGDKLWTERNARAEVYVGLAAVRLNSETGFSFLNVDDDTIQMRLTAGIINVSVHSLDGGEHIEIDTPNVALSLLRPGDYRVEVNDAGDSTVVKVREGSVQATGPSQDTVVYADQAVKFIGTDDLVARHTAIGATDDFDAWILERDRRDERVASSQTAQYVSPDVTGYQDLDDNGSWSSEPEYGYVWTPRYVAVGWAPYRYGRWVSISPWGWTWIDDAPWGYAPFHYGRWAHIRHRWCWVPGPRHHRAVYAPALVGWGGHRGNHVSWFPLGPRDVYVPGRRFSRNYIDRVNISNTRNVSRNHITEAYANSARNIIYRNREVPGAVTAVARNTFTTAGRTRDHHLRMSEVAGDQASAVAPQIAPVRESRLGGPRSNVRVPPRNIADRQVVVRRNPPPVAARYARSVAENRDVARVPDRVARPPDRVARPQEQVDRPQDREQTTRESRGVAALRDRTDRPRRERPAGEVAQPSQSSVFDRRALSDRVREDRDRQVREGQQQREVEHQRREVEQQQREAAARQRWQRPEEQARQYREQSQASREQQVREQQVREQPVRDRERVQRQSEVVRQTAPRVERERPVQREQRTERPQHVERSQPQRVERPQQAERPSRSEAPRSSEPKSQAPKSTEGRARHNRD